MPRPSVMIPVNSDLLRESILKRGSLASLESSLGVSRQAINGWLIKNRIPPRQLSAIARQLHLEPQEMTDITSPPKSRPYVLFRTNRNVAVAEDVKNDVLEIAEDFFALESITELDGTPQDVTVSSESHEGMAEVILRQLKLGPDQISIPSVITTLKKMNIYVLFYDFGPTFVEAKAQAVCVRKGDKKAIFINSNEHVEDVLWRIFHELCHLFSGHTETSVTDEDFCNKTASQVLMPDAFFAANRKDLRALLLRDISATPFIVEDLANKFSASFMGILLAFKKHRIFEGSTERYLWKVAHNRKKNAAKVSQIIEPMAGQNVVSFWTTALEDSNRSNFLQLQHVIRMGLILEKVSAKRGAELLKIDQPDIHKLAQLWTAQYEKKIGL